MNDKILFPINFIIVLIILFSSCSTNHNKDKAGDDEFLIKGKITNSKGEKLYLYELNINDKILLDSAVIDENGDFLIRHKIEEPGFYILYESGNNFITLVVDKGETISITADIRSLAKTYNVEGSEGSILLHQFETFTYENNKKVEKLSFEYEKNKNKPDFAKIIDSLDNEFFKILDDQKAKVKDFLKKNPGSLASLIVINRNFREHPVISETDDFYYFDLLDKKLSARYPGNKHVVEHNKRTNQMRMEREEANRAAIKLAPGQKIPYFSMLSINNDTVSSTDFENKLLVLYFWASWDASSRLTNLKLVPFYKKYHKKGVEIIGISIDDNPETWQAAIKIDKTPWIQLCDFRGKDSPVVKNYYIKKIPRLFLVDKNMCIIENDIDFETLEKKVSDILK